MQSGMLWTRQAHVISLLLQSNLCTLTPFQGQAFSDSRQQPSYLLQYRLDKDRQLQVQCWVPEGETEGSAGFNLPAQSTDPNVTPGALSSPAAWPFHTQLSSFL